MMDRIEQVKKVKNVLMNSLHIQHPCVINYDWVATEIVDTLEPTPKAETQRVVCPKPCKECRVPHTETADCWEICGYYTVGHCIPVPQPEPAKPEILSDELLTYEEIDKVLLSYYSIPDLKLKPYQMEILIATAQLAKCQQGAVLTASKYEARIKELEAKLIAQRPDNYFSEGLAKAKQDTRQQAFKEVGEYLSTNQNIHDSPVLNKIIDSLKRGVKP